MLLSPRRLQVGRQRRSDRSQDVGRARARFVQQVSQAVPRALLAREQHGLRDGDHLRGRHLVGRRAARHEEQHRQLASGLHLLRQHDCHPLWRSGVVHLEGRKVADVGQSGPNVHRAGGRQVYQPGRVSLRARHRGWRFGALLVLGEECRADGGQVGLRRRARRVLERQPAVPVRHPPPRLPRRGQRRADKDQALGPLHEALPRQIPDRRPPGALLLRRVHQQRGPHREPELPQPEVLSLLRVASAQPRPKLARRRVGADEPRLGGGQSGARGGAP
mmetsp:Transcript_37035/g.110193  ORF Transcript_37035/g.110193 Transcript_37035/m.110193 type:complete len:276 (-) Transcript_37035:277-1104(-)